MEHHTVTLKLPQHLLARASTIAQNQDVTIGHLVRKLLSNEVDRQLSAGATTQASSRLLSALEALLSRQFTLADSWEELSFRLGQEGFELRTEGKDLTIHRRHCGTRLCTTSDLGAPYHTLVERFGCGMPWPTQRLFNLRVDAFSFDPPVLPMAGDAQYDVIDYDA